MHFRKLSGTTTLFLVAIHFICFFGNGFSVRNARFLKFHDQTIQFFDSVSNDVKMQLTLSINNGLFELCILFNDQGGIFLLDLMERFHQFFHVRLAGWNNCRCNPWLREMYLFYFFGYAFGSQCIICMRIFQFNGHTNISGSQLINSYAVFSFRYKQLIDSFRNLMVHIVQFISGFHHSRIDFKIGNHAYLRF